MPAVLRKLLSILAFFICFPSLPALAVDLATGDATLDSGSGTCAPGKVPQTQNHFIGADRADFGKVADLGVNIQALEVPEDIEHLPPGSKGIAMVAQCTGVTQAFKDRITAHSSRDPDGTKIEAYWIGEEPQLSFCDPANLKAQADWIHENVPNGKTMAVLFEPSQPYGKYAESMDYVGVDPYPCKGGGACDYSYITRVANAMISDGVPREKIIPFYQSFGLADGENPQAQLNNVDQAKQLETWAAITPNPPFDNVWTWKPYGALLTLEDAPEQQAFFREMNACLAGMQQAEQPVAQPTEQPVTQPTEQPAQPTSARAERLGEFETRDNEFSASIDRFKKSKKTNDPRFADTLSRYEDMQARWSDFRGDTPPAIECEGATKAEKAAWIAAAGKKNWDFSCPSGNTTNEPAHTEETTEKPVTAGEATVTPQVGATTDKGTLIYSDEFNGTTLGKEWNVFDAWGTGKWHDATYDDKHIHLEDGKLVLTGSVGADGTFSTSYLQGYDQANLDAPSALKFGPGTRVEASIDLSGCGDVGSGAWCGFWLFDPTDTYDGNPANGTEIDIVERSSANAWSDTRYTAGNHYDAANKGSSNTWTDVVDPSQPGFHTYAVDWQEDKLTFSVDGQDVHTVTEGVSGSDNQAMMLSIENAIGSNSPWGPGTSNNSDAEMIVDYVRAYSTE